jgi:hypothetical protein
MHIYEFAVARFPKEENLFRELGLGFAETRVDRAANYVIYVTA